MPGGKATLTDEIPLFGGSGGLITTINDIAKWYADIDSGHRRRGRIQDPVRL